MKEDKTKSKKVSELRKRAEDALQGKDEELSTRDARSLIHELQVHQIELEMQNEELRRAQKNSKSRATGIQICMILRLLVIFLSIRMG